MHGLACQRDDAYIRNVVTRFVKSKASSFYCAFALTDLHRLL
jgi:hypothetical protein